MKRVSIIFYWLIIILLNSCHSEQSIPYAQPSLSYHILTRGIYQQEALSKGSQILLNAEGGLALENEIFTYNGSVWENNKNLTWNKLQETTHITAIHPVYEDMEYTTQNVYNDNGLEDVLIAQCTLSTSKEIKLEFNHLFSLLNIHIETKLLENIQEIRLTTPAKVVNIAPANGVISTIQEEHETIRANLGSNEYSFIIPPMENAPLTLILWMTDGSLHEMTLAAHTFQQGFEYECNLIHSDSQPGIRTADDLIDLCQLINNTYEGNKSMENFGVKSGEQMVFRLLNDIALQPEDCSQLFPIGVSKDHPFTHIFEGNNHTISGLILPDENTSNGDTGLFGYIGNTGIVRNLKITHATSVSQPQCSYVGVIAAHNYGIIDHCSVTNSTISSSDYSNIGLIASVSTGTILNCYTQNNQINLMEYSYGAGIASIAEGYILNCYTRENKFVEKDKKSYTSSIVATSTNTSPLTIENCYVYHTETNNRWGAAIAYSNKVMINHFYYNTGVFCFESPTSSTNYSKARTYDTRYRYNSTSISQLLNDWWTEENQKKYAGFIFTKWETAANGAPYFN